MAPDHLGPAMEASRSPDENRQPVDENMPMTDQWTSATPDVTPQRRKSPLSSIRKSSPKNGIPPKRSSVGYKRPPTAVPLSSSRTNASPASHGVSAAGLGKISVRTSGLSNIQRPAAAPSMSATLNSNTRKGATATFSEESSGNGAALEKSVNSKPRPTFRGSANGISARPTPASLTRPSLKTVLHKPSSNHRLATSVASGTLRNTKADADRKKLSAIPGSPSPRKANMTPTESRLDTASKPPRAVRPTLGTRKSTMSVTIEQRLREMEVVHNMLRIAMAEDGDEDDEVKEEYGKRADESLASLRLSLEEARRIEGVDQREPTFQESTSPAVHPEHNTDKLQISLAESENKISILVGEIDNFKNRIEHLENSEQSLIEKEQRFLSQHTSQISEIRQNHERELSDLQSRLEEAETKHKEDLRLSIYSLEEANQLAISRQAQEAAEKLDCNMQLYASQLHSLEADLVNEKDRTSDAVNSLEKLNSELSTAHALLSAEKQLSNDVNDRIQHYLFVIDEKDKELASKNDTIADLQEDIRSLHAVQKQKLEEVEANAQSQLRNLESGHATFDSKIHKLELTQQSMTVTHNQALDLKNREINDLGRIIEGFQNKMRDLHEMRERDVDQTKLNLILQHEKVVSDLKLGHLDESNRAVEKHQEEIEYLKGEHRTDIISLQFTHTKELEYLQSRLDGFENKDKELENLKQHVHDLTTERDKAVAAKATANEALQDVLDEPGEGAGRVVKALNDGSHPKDEQSADEMDRLMDELERATKLLEDEVAKGGSPTKRHAAEIKSLKSQYARETELLKSSNQKTLQALEEKYKDLLAGNTQIRNLSIRLSELKSEYVQLFSSYAEALQDLRASRAGETDDDMASEAERKYSEQLIKLQLNFDEKYRTFYSRLEGDSLIEAMTNQITHRATVSELGTQAQADENPQQDAEAMIWESDNDPNGNLDGQLDSLKAELSDTQNQLAKAEEEITKLIDAAQAADRRKSGEISDEISQLQEQLSELAQQRTTEIVRLQETLAIENEKRAKERKAGAEVRDRLAAELNRMGAELFGFKAQIDENQKALRLSAYQVQEADNNALIARQIAEHHRSELRKAADELKAAHAEVNKRRTIKFKSENSHSGVYNQELEALQLAADSERAQNDKLKQKLSEAQSTMERQATKLREAECALKVTTAELVEAQTPRPNGHEFSASPAPKSGLRTSRWAVSENASRDGHSDVTDDDSLGPSIEGNMAGMQEQIRQIGEINDDMQADAQRIMNIMSKVNGQVFRPNLAKLSSEEEPI